MARKAVRHSVRRYARTAFTPLRRRIIIEAIAAGNHYQTAAAAAGIPADTLHMWIEDGRKGKRQDLAKFAEDVERAEADSEKLALAIVQKHAAGFVKKVTRTVKGPDGTTETIEEHEESDWRAAAFIMQQRWSHRWNLARRLKFSGALDVRQHVIVHTDPADALRIIEAEEGLLLQENENGERVPLLPEGPSVEDPVDEEPD
jgi:hypothetical protein